MEEEDDIESGRTLQDAVREVSFRKRDGDEEGEIMFRGGSDGVLI